MARTSSKHSSSGGAEPSKSVVPRLFVSSAHLVSAKSRELSEFEFGLIIASNAFNRWVVRCMAAAGVKEMTTLEVLLLHHVNHRGRESRSWESWRAFFERFLVSMIRRPGPQRRFSQPLVVPAKRPGSSRE